MAFSKYVVLGALLGMTAVGPAAAEDCFPKVRAFDARPPVPVKARPTVRKPAAARPATPVRRVGKPVVRKARPVVAAAKPALPSKPLVDSSFAMQTGALPPAPSVECDRTPSIQAALPPEAKPAAQRLLDEIAGPMPDEALAPPTELASNALPPMFGFPFGGGGPGGGGFGGGGGGGGGGGNPGEPGGPGEPEPPIVPPTVIVPPTEPPTEPPVIPPLTPEPPIVPPTTPIIPPVSAVPEPATWAMLIIGFFGLGSAIRSKRARLSVTQAL